MSDRGLRDLERRAKGGDVQAQDRLGLELLRAGLGRDPKRTPREGDVVRIRVPGHLDRWDEREVGQVVLWGGSGHDDVNNVHWRRTKRSLQQLRRWGNFRQSNTMAVRSWRMWCRKSQQGEVIKVAYNPPGPRPPEQIPRGATAPAGPLTWSHTSLTIWADSNTTWADRNTEAPA